MNAIEYIKKYQDTKKELSKMNNLYTDLVIDYFKIKSELEEAKKQVAGWSAMAGRYASGQ
jgi:hypothetical protein|tara:strand:+ start:73 stop:252 length:180 start_codon:yes stop_codon:yes gene_type:complete